MSYTMTFETTVLLFTVLVITVISGGAAVYAYYKMEDKAPIKK